jgi:hypothetical protein
MSHVQTRAEALALTVAGRLTGRQAWYEEAADNDDSEETEGFIVHEDGDDAPFQMPSEDLLLQVLLATIPDSY